nr:TlpA family protein disulfide reductase [Actinomycetota bacterium]
TGSPAPEFELPKLDGGSLSSRELKGHPVVLNFWASWCIPCREEAPVLERTWRAYRDQGVIFVGVNIRDAESSAKEFVDEFNITYPVVRDVNLELERELGLTGLPETYFIDDEWRFVSNVSGAGQGRQQGSVILGAISEEQLVTNVETLIRRADDSGADK